MSKTLGRKIVIPANTKVESGVTRVVFAEKTYEVNIGIGNDHTATLYIGEEALKELSKFKHEIEL